jgi:hypothetical protein
MAQKERRISVECLIAFRDFIWLLICRNSLQLVSRGRESGHIFNTFLAVHIVWYFAVQHGIMTQHYQSVGVQRNGRKVD